MTIVASLDAITIRPATDADVPALSEIYNHYIEHTPATFDLEPYSVEDYREQWFNLHASVGPHRVFVAETGGEILGMSYSSQYQAKAANKITVTTGVYCAPGQTGNSLGRRLYHALFTALQEEDVSQAVALITQPNRPSETLHERCGFTRVGVLRGVGRKFGEEWDTAIWQRPVRAGSRIAARRKHGAMRIRIGLGLAGFPFDDHTGFWRWVDQCETGGIDSLWYSDRLVSTQPILESMSVMAALAGATERMKFGMNVVVVPFRDPLVLAKQCATIDILSGGRLLPAFGVGAATSPEWRATGRSSAGRGTWTDEALEIMRRLWCEERVSFNGKYLHYEDASIAPRPVQQPLPLWIGGASLAAIRRTARIGTGWLAGVQAPEQVAHTVRAIKAAAAEAGREIPEDHYGAGFAYRFGNWDDPSVERTAAGLARRGPEVDPKRYLAVGGADQIVSRIGEYAQGGVSKFVLRAVAEDATDVYHQTQHLIEDVLPQVQDVSVDLAPPA